MKEALMTLAPYIAPQVPGCPNPMIEQQIRRAAIETCNYTRYWKKTLYPLIPDEPTDNYQFLLNPNEDRNQIEWATWDGKALLPMAEEQITLHQPEGYRERVNTPTHYYEKENRCIHVFPPPFPELEKWEPKQLVVRASLRPSLQATSMEAGPFQDMYNVLINGALGYLLSMSKKEWSDPALAEGYLANFSNGNEEYKRRARDSNVVPARRVKYAGV